MSQSLLTISDDLDALDDLLAEVGGDITNPDVCAAVDAWFAEIDTAFNSKVDGYAALIQTMEARAEIRRAEAARLTNRAKSDEGSAEFLRARLKAVLEQRGTKKMETARFRVSIAANGGKQAIEVTLPTESLPAWAVRTKVVIDPDKDAIRAKLEAGESLEFATLLPRGSRLSIK